ncbi:MAG: hypothetical protein ACRCXT_21020 [Paraclostridium sp.]
MALDKNDGNFRPIIDDIVSGKTSQVAGVNEILNNLIGNDNYLKGKKLDNGNYIGTAEDLSNDTKKRLPYENTVEDLKNSKKYNIDDVVKILGGHTKVDGDFQFKIISTTDYGDGVLLNNGLYANRIYGLSDIGKINYVDLLKEKPKFKQISKDSDDEYTIQYIYGEKTIVLIFNRIANTAYFTQSTVLLADWLYDPTYESGLKYNQNTSKTGTWVDSTDSINGYTAVTDSTIVFEINNAVENSVLCTRHQCRSDGGEFEIMVEKDGKVLKTIRVTTYNENSVKKTFNLLEGAKTGVYKVTYKFVGNGSRGWLTSLQQNVCFFTENIFSFTNTTYFTTPSNKDYAIEFKPLTASNYQFMPSHSGIQTCFDRLKMDIIIDGKLSSLAIGEKRLFESNVEFMQHINIKHPESQNNSATVETITTFDEFGVLKYYGNITLLEDTMFKNGYTMMCIANTENFNKLVTSNKNRYTFSLDEFGIRKNIFDGYNSNSYLFSGDSDMILAMTVNNPISTWRIKEQNRIKSCYLQIRDKYITKLYTNIFGIEGTVLKSGEVITFEGEYLFLGNFGCKTKAISLR